MARLRGGTGHDGPAVWLESDYGISVPDGQPCDVWRGMAARPAVYAIGAQRPTYIASATPTGKGALRFNGTTNYMESDPRSVRLISNPSTFLVVCKNSDADIATDPATPPASGRKLFDIADWIDGGATFWKMPNLSAGAEGLLKGGIWSMAWTAGRGWTNDGSVTPTPPLVDTGWHIITGRSLGSSAEGRLAVRFQVDNLPESVNVIDILARSDWENSADGGNHRFYPYRNVQLTLGDIGFHAQRPWEGDIAALMVWSRAMGDAEFTSHKTRLQGKYLV